MQARFMKFQQPNFAKRGTVKSRKLAQILSE
jgi:hypothetical protein